jgi:hypothetical protein
VPAAHGNLDSISKSTPLPDWLLKYHEWGCNNTEIPRYLISTYEAQALVLLARLVGAKRGASDHCSAMRETIVDPIALDG